MILSQYRRSAFLMVVFIHMFGICADGADPASPGRVDTTEIYSKLVEEHAQGVVTVKFTMNEFIGHVEYETTGTIVTPDGVVIVASSQLVGLLGLGAPVGLSEELASVGVSSGLVELNVVLEDGSRSLSAELIAEDTNLDLAWIQITDPGFEALPHVRFGGGAQLELGDTYFSVSRLGTEFGRVPVVEQGTVSGVLDDVNGSVVCTTSIGKVVYTSDLEVAGFTVMARINVSKPAPVRLRRPVLILPARYVAIELHQILDAREK